MILLPLVPLGIVYMRLSRQGGPIKPLWANLTWPDLLGLGSRLGWVDPLTLSKKMVLPFTEHTSAFYGIRAGGLALPGVVIALAGSIAAGLTGTGNLAGRPRCRSWSPPGASLPAVAGGLVALRCAHAPGWNSRT